MPKLTMTDFEIYFELAGKPSNPPLLLITGLSSYTADSWAQKPAFQDILNGAWYLVGDGFLDAYPDVLDKWTEIAANNPQTEAAYMAQLQAIATHDVYDLLPQIKHPTLVLHGTEDILVPSANGRLIADHIPNATLKLYPNCGHMFFWEAATAVNADLHAFFKAHHVS